MQFLKQVAGIEGSFVEKFESAADDQVDLRFEEPGRDIFGIGSAVDVGDEGGGCGVGDAAGGYESGCKSLIFSLFQNCFTFFLLGVHSDSAVVGFTAAGKGGGAGSRVGDEVAFGVGGHESGDRKSLQVEFLAVEVVARADLRQAHPIADEQDDIFRARGDRVGGWHCGGQQQEAELEQEFHGAKIRRGGGEISGGV